MADAETSSNSKYRVALASSDGESVNIHYGKCNLFYIYAIDDDVGYDLIEKRSVTSVCQDGSHVKSAMEESVKQFLDCKYVVASRIGPGAAQALTSEGIISMELPGSIDNAILKVWKYNRVQRLFD